MEETAVVIVGAGPSGLAMGLALAKYRIQSIILEKERDINTDPRGVYLNGDAVRILYDLGLVEWDEIGHEPKTINFHKTSFKSQPFYIMDTSEDFLSQCVPNGFLHVQPKLEAALAQHINASEYCALRRGCTVSSRETFDDYMVIHYQDISSTERSIRCTWLIGADGKKGVVRKHFLEPTAGIIQEDSSYRYEGTWVAANIRIILPTPETHPDLPFWSLEMEPEAVYDLYWPKDWHFCTPPGKPTACGRFGPYDDRLWRHEFAEHGWNESMDAVELFWEHITPMITRDRDTSGQSLPGGPVAYPQDCIEILRCRPFTFTHKVVNKWFDGRTVLIGDAAHVFPPFGGEGIASGIRDAHQLAWRIGLAETTTLPSSAMEQLLDAWMTERRQGIKNAADFTKLNGTLCNEPESWGFYAFRHIEALLKLLPFSSLLPNPRSIKEARGYRGVKDGFFLPEFGGGGKLAQIFVESGGEQVMLSDRLLRHDREMLTLLILDAGQTEEAINVVRKACLPPSVLSPNAIVVFDASSMAGSTLHSTAKPVTAAHSNGAKLPKGYNPAIFLDRLGRSKMTAYAIIRPDFYIFALLKDAAQLQRALMDLKALLSPRNANGLNLRSML